MDAAQSGVAVPEQHVQEGRIVLNVSYAATSRLELANDEITFDARFGGVPRSVRVPLSAVLGIYAKETGEGLVFPTDEYAPPSGEGPDSGPPPDAPSPPPSGRPSLKIVR